MMNKESENPIANSSGLSTASQVIDFTSAPQIFKEDQGTSAIPPNVEEVIIQKESLNHNAPTVQSL